MKCFFKIILVLMSPLCLAQEKKIDNAQLIQIMKAVPKPQNLQVKFENQSISPMQKLRGQDKGIQVSGFAKLQAPDRFRWVIESKDPVEYRFDGKNAYMIRPMDRSVTKFGSQGSQAQEFKNLARTLLHIEALLNEYSVEESLIDEKNQMLRLSLIPKSVREIVAIAVQVDLGLGYIRELKMTQKSGRQSNYSFKDPIFSKIPHHDFALEKQHESYKLSSYD